MLIKNIRLINPATNTDKVTDIQIEDGIIKDIDHINIKDENTIDGTNLIAAPGFVDVHVHFRDPGFTHKEDLLSGSKAAARGGYTSVVCMANTKPTMDNENTLKDFLKRAEKSPINVHTVVSLTKNLMGEELVDMEGLIEVGAKGFSDDGIPNMNLNIIIEAMNRAEKLGVPISFHEENPHLNVENGINHGEISEEMGLYGSPALSEEIMIARDGLLSLRTGARVDIQHISSEGGVDLVRYYKKRGANLFAEVTPHHFSSTEELIRAKGTLAKMNPPLRTQRDRLAIIEGLKDDTIEIIATDHAPHTEEEKNVQFTKAPSGIIGLETALGLGIKNLVQKGHLTLDKLIEKMTINPAKLYNLRAGNLVKGYSADIVIFDNKEEYTVKDFSSKSKNSPYIGEKLPGKIKYTICRGNIVYKDL
ncbi:Dihydroorotase [Peptoniphilus sp. ING2-D1G]|nr:Dihydroorotase [Peptoniphilus sp. ING2-D1G]